MPSVRAVEAFERMAAFTWQTLARVAAQRTTIREETLTDMNLLSMEEASSAEIRIYKARGTDERRFGFDWEWYIGSGTRWWRYAVQAKKLSFKGRYESLRQRPPRRRSRYQINVLKAHSKSVGAIPVYCLYNYVPTVTDRHWHCTHPFEREQLGCSIAPLAVVERYHRRMRPRTFAALHTSQYAVPARCLVACPNFNPSSGTRNPLQRPILAGRGSGVALDEEGIEIHADVHAFATWETPGFVPTSSTALPPSPLVERPPPFLADERLDGTYSPEDFPGLAYPRAVAVVRIPELAPEKRARRKYYFNIKLVNGDVAIELDLDRE